MVIKYKIHFYKYKFSWWKSTKRKAPHRCLSLIMLDSVIKSKKKYYHQILLKECKYEPKKTKIKNLIDDDLKKRLSDESDNDSGDETESNNEKDSDEPDE